jgi:predicted nucleotidyltransferase
MAEKKDHSYKTVKIVMEAGQIKNFKDIFKIIPKSVVGKDMHTNNSMQRLINNPGSFTYDEINQMADLIGCEYILLRDLVEKGARLVGNKKEAKKSNEAKTKA